MNELIGRSSSPLELERQQQQQESNSTNVHEQPQPSTSSSQQETNHASSDEDDNDNDDDDDDDWNNSPSTSNIYLRPSVRLNHNLYRTSNMNLVRQERTIPLPPVQIQINDAPFTLMSRQQQRIEQQQNFMQQQRRIANELRPLPSIGLYRPRFLHPLYPSSTSLETDFDDPQQREQLIYDTDIITTVTPNHRIQAWDISNWTVPAINNCTLILREK